MIGFGISFSTENGLVISYLVSLPYLQYTRRNPWVRKVLMIAATAARFVAGLKNTYDEKKKGLVIDVGFLDMGYHRWVYFQIHPQDERQGEERTMTS